MGLNSLGLVLSSRSSLDLRAKMLSNFHVLAVLGCIGACCMRPVFRMQDFIGKMNPTFTFQGVQVFLHEAKWGV